MWKLGLVPEGFYSDEALYGYEAYSLLRTGKDQFGHPWPVSIAGFGDYRPAFYIYSTIPFIALGGLTEYMTRLPSALYGIATLLVTYLFIKGITGNTKAALMGVLLMSLSPWSIYFSRMAHETNLMTLLILSGIYILWRYKDHTWGIILGVVFFTAAMYTYHTARIFVPLFLIFTALLYKKKVRKHLPQLLFGLALFFILLMPLFNEFRTEAGWSRVQGLSIWNDPGVIGQINDTRGQIQNLTHPLLARLIINKAVYLPFIFLKNMLGHFSPQFLIMKGDPNGIYSTPNVGILLWIEIPLVLFGGMYIWSKNKNLFWWLLGASCFSLIADSLTRVSPSSARIHLLLPFLATWTGCGFVYLTTHFSRYRIWVYACCLVLLFLNSWWFLYNYYVVLPAQNARIWQVGLKELALKAEGLLPYYDKIWISRSGGGWIHILFHTRYDPATFQKQAKIAERNDTGFWWVSDFGKYHLEWFPQAFDQSGNTLYIGTPQEFPKTVSSFANIEKHGHILYLFASGDRIVEYNKK